MCFGIYGACNRVRNYLHLYIFVDIYFGCIMTTLLVSTCTALIDGLSNPKTIFGYFCNRSSN